MYYKLTDLYLFARNRDSNLKIDFLDLLVNITVKNFNLPGYKTQDFFRFNLELKNLNLIIKNLNLDKY